MRNVKTATIQLIIINIICFVLTLGGTLFANVLGNNYVYTVSHFQIYRLFTNLFYHFGFMHLLCNMFSLLQIGMVIEYLYGKKQMLFCYFTTGILGSFISCIIHHILGHNVLSAGASGAICGLLGVLLGSLNKFSNNKYQTIFLTLLPIILIGFQGGVDNIAHWTCLFLGFGLSKFMKK